MHAVAQKSLSGKFMCKDCDAARRRNREAPPAARAEEAGRAAQSRRRRRTRRQGSAREPAAAARRRRRPGVHAQQEVRALEALEWASMNAPLKKLPSSPASSSTAAHRLRAAEEAQDSPKLKLHRKAKRTIDPGHVRGRAPRPVERERGARRHHPAPVGLAGGDVRPRPQSLDPHRGRRVRVFRPVHAVHVRASPTRRWKWTLENRSDNPGIADGDMFLANDPWVGARTRWT